MNLSRALRIARQLVDDYRLYGWEVGLEDLTDEALLGCCYPRKKRITLDVNSTLVGSEEDVTDTILHEIAHALAPPGSAHGPKFKAMFRQVREDHRDGGPPIFRADGSWRY